MAINNGGAVVTTGTTYVGNSGGAGTISFANGTLMTNSLYVSSTQLAGTGTIYTKGIVADGSFNFGPGPIQPVPFNNVTVNVNMSDPSNIGDLGTAISATVR